TPSAVGTYEAILSITNALSSEIRELTITVNDYSSFDYAMDVTPVYTGGTLANQKILVPLSESNATLHALGFRYNQLKSDGADLRFLSPSGKELAYEIQQWNPLGESSARVNLPTLASGDKVIMRWGNSYVSAPSYSMSGTDWSGNVAFSNFQGPPTPVSPLELHGKVGSALSHNLEYRGSQPMSYSAVGLPPGLDINVVSGEISGTPVTAGETQFTVTVTGQNAAGNPKSDVL
ncbi:uncharacterized protein METZ01_LOCUS502757, partial [marine metagenome]